MDDNQGREPAAPAAAGGAPADDAYQSDVSFADLDAESAAAAEPAADADAEKADDATETGTDSEADDDASDEDEDAAGDDDDEEDAERDEDKNRRRSRNARYRDRIARLEEQNAQLRSRQGGSLSEAELDRRVREEVGPEPQEKDFADYLAFEKEHTAWLLDKRQVAREVKRAAANDEVAHNARRSALAEAHQDRVEAFRNRSGKESAKDFDAVIAGAKDLKASPVVEDLVLESRKSGHLVYYFAKNPDRLNALNRMGPLAAAREIGRIEARLSLPKPKTQTSAPAPKATPRGGAAPYNPDADLSGYLKKTYG